MDPISGIKHFAEKQLSLLEKEREAEMEHTTETIKRTPPSALQARGLACLALLISQYRTGLGGKTIVDLEPDPAVNSSGIIPPHGIRTGDIVQIQEQVGGSAKKQVKQEASENGLTGVIVKATDQKISVALDKPDSDMNTSKRMWMVKLSNDAPFKRMSQTMEKLQTKQETDLSELARVAFGISKPSIPQTQDVRIAFFDENLNDSQREAVRFAIASHEIALIHGPPGTGKTHTLIELIRQLVAKGLRLLVCGPSNISVDNIAERLTPFGIPIVRLGHPARLLESVLVNSLDILTQTSEAGALVKDVRKEMDEKMASVKKTRNAKERREIWKDVSELRKEYRERERRCVNEIIKGSKVVLSTLHGSGGYNLNGEKFDVVIIDEGSQALEAQCWIPLLNASKCILAGDHLQLPPTVKTSKFSPNIGSHGLETTLFDRLLKLHGDQIKRLLTCQYRMHQNIMNYPSDALYDSLLIAADSVKQRLLSELPNVKETDDTREPLVFWDTQGDDFPERLSEEVKDQKGSNILDDSKSNEMEAALCRLHVCNLIKAGVRPVDIAVISPYNAQLAILSDILKTEYPSLELSSVDGFQGREKEAVILSLVRSNDKREVGFLGDKRRLNVAMTRPKRHLCVIGNSDTIRSGNTFLKNWMEYLEEKADLRYPDLAQLTRAT